jgi:hypothetical protein
MTMMTLVWIILGLFVVIGLYLGVVVFSPWLKEPEAALPSTGDSSRAEAAESGSGLTRPVRFTVDGIEIAAELYLPDDAAAPVPCIVLNNGLGGTREIVVGAFARRFREAGFAALTYDYRHFGASGGEPRQLYLGDLQVADCRAAVAFVRQLPEIDATRVAVWGTSVAGGYGLQLAAEDPGIACVVAQCASLDHGADGRLIFAREGIGYFFRLFIHGARDKGRARFGLSAHHIAVVGRPGSTAILTGPGLLEDCARVFGAGFDNRICARVMLTPHGPTASDVIDRVRAPVLIQICEKDPLVSMDGSLGMASRLGALAQVKRYPIGHFDLYLGKDFERSVADQIEFFTQHLLGTEE